MCVCERERGGGGGLRFFAITGRLSVFIKGCSRLVLSKLFLLKHILFRQFFLFETVLTAGDIDPRDVESILSLVILSFFVLEVREGTLCELEQHGLVSMLSIPKEIVDISHPFFLSYILLFGFVRDREYASDVDYHITRALVFFFFFFLHSLQVLLRVIALGPRDFVKLKLEVLLNTLLIPGYKPRLRKHRRW